MCFCLVSGCFCFSIYFDQTNKMPRQTGDGTFYIWDCWLHSKHPNLWARDPSCYCRIVEYCLACTAVIRGLQQSQFLAQVWSLKQPRFRWVFFRWHWAPSMSADIHGLQAVMNERPPKGSRHPSHDFQKQIIYQSTDLDSLEWSRYIRYIRFQVFQIYVPRARTTWQVIVAS